MNVPKIFLVLMISAAALALSACGKPVGLPGQNNTASYANGVTFAALNKNVFQPKCLSCHTGVVPDFSSYANIMASGMVVAGNPGGSRLYLDVAAGIMPKGGPALAQTDIDAISQWIAQGALNNGDPATVPGGSPTPVPSATPVPTPIPGARALGPDFASINYYIFTPKCVSCHSNPNPSGNYDMSSYTGVLTGGRVVPFNASGSLLYQKVSSALMPPGGPALSTTELQAISQWITNGANNDGAPIVSASPIPSPTPIPLAPTYQSIYANIIGKYCISCHGAVNPKENVNLSTYTSTLRYLVPFNSASSKLYTEVQSNSMPQGGPALTAAQKSAIKTWIDQGAQNN